MNIGFDDRPSDFVVFMFVIYISLCVYVETCNCFRSLVSCHAFLSDFKSLSLFPIIEGNLSTEVI